MSYHIFDYFLSPNIFEKLLSVNEKLPLFYKLVLKSAEIQHRTII